MEIVLNKIHLGCELPGNVTPLTSEENVSTVKQLAMKFDLRSSRRNSVEIADKENIGRQPQMEDNKTIVLDVEFHEENIVIFET